MFPIRMPSVAENISEATLGRWLVREGDEIAAGQGVAEIVTEKAAFTLEADTGGKVTALLVSEKSVLPAGAILCVLDATADEVAAARAENEKLLASHAAALAAGCQAAAQANEIIRPVSFSGMRATPAARRLAKEHNIDLADVAARISDDRPLREEDVREYIAARGVQEENRDP